MMRSRRGFSLLEMLITIILLGTAALLLPRLFRATMRVVREAPQARDAIVRHDIAIEALRRDVWSAREVEVLDEGRAIQLRSGSGAKCRWALTASDEPDEIVLERSADGGRQTWRIAQPKLSFAKWSSGIAIQGSTPSDSISMASELILLRSGK